MMKKKMVGHKMKSQRGALKEFNKFLNKSSKNSILEVKKLVEKNLKNLDSMEDIGRKYSFIRLEIRKQINKDSKEMWRNPKFRNIVEFLITSNTRPKNLKKAVKSTVDNRKRCEFC